MKVVKPLWRKAWPVCLAVSSFMVIGSASLTHAGIPTIDEYSRMVEEARRQTVDVGPILHPGIPRQADIPSHDADHKSNARSMKVIDQELVRLSHQIEQQAYDRNMAQSASRATVSARAGQAESRLVAQLRRKVALVEDRVEHEQAVMRINRIALRTPVVSVVGVPQPVSDAAPLIGAVTAPNAPPAPIQTRCPEANRSDVPMPQGPALSSPQTF